MSPGAPKVTIGLPVRNGERFLERAIDSVLGQTFDDLEPVISDNASTDRTQEICASYASRDPRVRVFRNDPDIGVLRNFNRLVELARGEYFRWLGVDDWLELDYVSECVAALDANPHCIAVTTSARSALQHVPSPENRVDSAA
jgi:glycosyltransferase involved in cell wall biosynthesis